MKLRTLLLVAALIDPPVTLGRSTPLAGAIITHSVPAAPFLREAARAGHRPVLRQRHAKSGWREIALGAPAGSPCRFVNGDTLLAARSGGPDQVLECELSLFGPTVRLRREWRLQRLHWSGDLPAATLIQDPRDTDKPGFRVRLKTPSDATASTLTLLIAVLNGPQTQSWPTALGN